MTTDQIFERGHIRVALTEKNRCTKRFYDPDALLEWIKFYIKQKTLWALARNPSGYYALYIERRRD